MSIRVWVSPPVVTGEVQTTKAEQYCSGGFVNFFPTNADGTPASPWLITVGRAANWASADADAELSDLFGGDLPSNIDTPSALRALLRTRTVADVPLARRNAIMAVLDAKGVVRSDFVGSTSLWKVFQRAVSSLIEKDANFGSGFQF